MSENLKNDGDKIPKDLSLFVLSQKFNTARFVSYGLDKNGQINQRYTNFNATENIDETITKLLKLSSSKKINIRSFKPDQHKGCPFNYGIDNIKEVRSIIQKLLALGYIVILNELIDISDGGVSGVIQDDIIEFAPNSTPKSVEKDGCCSMPKDLGFDILRGIYGIDLGSRIPITAKHRIEFSIHPNDVGIKNDKYIVWEVEQYEYVNTSNPTILLENNFSKHIGNKTFGLLLVNSILKNRVPTTRVINIYLDDPNIGFGRKPTLIVEDEKLWYRTAPAVKEPGKYPTVRGSFDIDAFYESLGDDKHKVPTILIQANIDAKYSGVAKICDDKISGEYVSGYGDDYMVGNHTGDITKFHNLQEAPIPNFVYSINTILKELSGIIPGDLSIEFVVDNTGHVWVVQLSQEFTGKLLNSDNIIYPGNFDVFPEDVLNFNTDEKSISEFYSELDQENPKVVYLVGNVGLLSHYCDILRLRKIPSKLIK